MTKRSLVIYVSGPYTGTPAEITSNIKKAREASIEIWQRGFTALSPIQNTANFELDSTLQYDDYMEGDLVLLGKSDAVFLIDGWSKSKGSKMEMQKAIQRRIPCFTSMDELEEWAEKKLEVR